MRGPRTLRSTTRSGARWRPQASRERKRNSRRGGRSGRNQRQKDRGQERKPEAGQGDPVARFKQAQKEFIQVAGVADFDPKAKTRAGELREKMKRASQEIARDPARMRAAERMAWRLVLGGGDQSTREIGGHL